MSATQPNDPQQDPASSRRWAKFFEITRYVTGGMLLIGGFVYALVAYFYDDVRLCQDRLASNGSTVKICNPPSSDDAVLIALLIGLCLLCFWPSLSEISLPGFVSLKRRVQANEQQIETLERTIQNISVSQNTGVYIGLGLGDALSTASQKVDAIQSGKEPLPIPTPTDKALPTSPSRASYIVQILEAWSRLSPYVDAAYGRSLRTKNSNNIDRPSWVLDWREVFRSELEQLRLIRNAVAHPPTDLTDEQLLEGVELANRLVESLNVMRTRYESSEG